MKRFLLILALSLALPGMARAATERYASVGFCEGCSNPDNVTVYLVIDNGGNWTAQVSHLQLVGGQWEGTGRLDYEGQGIKVHEAAAHFAVIFEPSPSTNPACARVMKFPSSIVVTGATGSLATTSMTWQTDTLCPRAQYSVAITGQPLLKVRRRISVSGRSLAP